MYNISMMKNIEKRSSALKLRLEGRGYEFIGRELCISRQRAQQLISPPPEVRNYVVTKAKGKCEICGVIVGRSGHIHHRGGNGEDYNDIENLQLLCISCHRSEHRGENHTKWGPRTKYLEPSSAQMPTKDTRAIGVRITNELFEQIMQRANRKGWTFNKWMNQAALDSIRSHKKKEGG